MPTLWQRPYGPVAASAARRPVGPTGGVDRQLELSPGRRPTEYFGPKLACDRDSVRFVPVDVGDGRGAERVREGDGVNADRASATDHEHLGSGRLAQSRSDRTVGVGEIVARRRSCTCAHPVRERDEGMVCPGNADSVRKQTAEVAA